MNPHISFVRSFHPGMGQAVAERNVLRPILNGDWEGETFALNPRQPGLHKWAGAAHYAGAEVILDDTTPIKEGTPDARWETWDEVAVRVANGNTTLCQDGEDYLSEFLELRRHIAKAADGHTLVTRADGLGRILDHHHRRRRHNSQLRHLLPRRTPRRQHAKSRRRRLQGDAV